MSDGHPIVWIDGERQPFDGAHISARDRGVTLADGVFETMKAHRGKVFRLDRHLARLTNALRVLQIPQPLELEGWVKTAIDSARVDHGVVRVTVTRGVAPGGVTPPREPVPTVIVIVTPMPPPVRELYERGVTGHVASGRRNEWALTAGLKTLSFTEAIAATLEAQRAGADEALLLDTSGHWSEGAVSNLFLVTRSIVVTPPLTCGVLPGITRAVVLELCRGMAITAEERIVVADELAGADEAFLTSSFRGIMPLVRVGTANIGAGLPGGITRQLMDAYASLVERECGDEPLRTSFESTNTNPRTEHVQP